MTIKNKWNNQKSFPENLIIAKELVYDCCDFEVTEPQPEAESNDYDAYRFYLNGNHKMLSPAKIPTAPST